MASLFSLSCGCRDSKSASVSDGSGTSTSAPRRPRKPPSSTHIPSLTSLTSTDNNSDIDQLTSSPMTPSFSSLLQQLSELESSVMEWWPEGRRLNRGKVAESVAVVTESADPLGDFRRSMLQMIVEKEIVGGDELTDLLRRFLALNSPRYHELILRAFADIWADVFAGLEKTPDLLRGRPHRR